MNVPFIVAEIGGNHRGSYLGAEDLVRAAFHAGADAVKFQCFKPDQMVDPEATAVGGPWHGRRLIDLYRETETRREWFPALFKVARDHGLVPFASVFHPDDVDFLETLDCPIYKIASFELTDLDLISHTARTGKPIMLSLGMATWVEICCAMSAVYPWNDHGIRGPSDATLLKCTSAYPAQPSDANLATMRDLMEKCVGWNVGLSDHTLGLGVACAAAAMGASVIEKHLIMERSEGGPDAAFSLEPDEFAQMVKECRAAAAAVGTPTYGPTASEANSLQFRRKPGGRRGI